MVDHRVLQQQPDEGEEEGGQADPERHESAVVGGQGVAVSPLFGGHRRHAPTRREVAEDAQGHERQNYEFEHGPAGKRTFEGRLRGSARSEEHTSELQSLMRTSYAVFCLKKKHKTKYKAHPTNATLKELHASKT